MEQYHSASDKKSAVHCQIKCFFNATIVRPQLYDKQQDKTIQSVTITK